MSRKQYPKYKPSGVAWLGEVPEGWEVKRLKYQVSINDETLPETTDPDHEMLYVDISSVDPTKGIVNKETHIFENAPSRARRVVRDGDTIVSTVRTYLRAISPVKEPEENLIVSTGFAVIRPRTIDKNYLSSTIRTPYFIEEVVSRSVGVSYPAINASELGLINIPLPPLPEQQAIAAFLDRETGRIDALIAKKKRLIALLKEKRRAMISRAVTKGLDPSVKMKPSGVPWLGDVPEGWEVRRAGSAYQIQLGKMLQPDTSSPEDEQLEYLKALHVQWEHIQIDDLPVMWASPNDIKKYAVSKGDLLVCEGGEVGRAGILKHSLQNVIIQNSLHRVRSTENLNTFLMYVLENAASKNWFDILCNKATIAHFTGDKFSALLIPLPPLPEQQAIAAFLDRETARIDALVSKVETAIERLKEYRTSLISSAVTGKIDVRDEV